MLIQSKAEELREQIKKEAARKGLGYTELARAAGVSYDDVRLFLSGRIVKPNYFNIVAIKEALGLESEAFTAPYRGEVGAGDPRNCDPFNEYGEDDMHVPVPYHIKDGVVFKLVGDSMNKEIAEDSYVLVTPFHGNLNDIDKRIVIICDDNNALTCKRYDHTTRTAVPCSTSKHTSINLKDPDKQIVGIVRHAFKNWGI